MCEAIERNPDGDRQVELDRLIVEAYTQRPPEDPWTESAAEQMIAAKPW